MPSIPYDPCGHTKIAVADFKRSYLFYKAIFEELGYKQVSAKADRAGWASREGYGVLISQAATPKYKYKFDAPGLHHLCLKARSVKQVNQIYKLLLKQRVYIFDAPQKIPEYTDKYYAVYFADPDGIKLEVAYY
ncbi:MAG: VOC family protein [Patescibacteria group bacterium]|jgi:catechol 2,3-dioxygenase-like lactoylglutathione lyase family enzyme